MANTGGIWTGLLKWSLAQPSFGESTDVKPMSEEDKKFLSNVFDNLVVDEVRRMKIVVEILKMPDDEAGLQRLVQSSASMLEKLTEVALPRTELEHYGGATLQQPTPASTTRTRSPSHSVSPSAVAEAAAIGPVPTLADYQRASIPELRAEVIRRKEGALEELDDRVLTSDNANDFMTVGGLPPLLQCLSSSSHGVRWRAAQALSTITQNNPKAQKIACENHAIEALVPLLTPPPPPPASSTDDAAQDAYAEKWTVVVKALTALSAIVRSDDQPLIRETFMRASGFARLCALLLVPHVTPRVQTKIFQFLKHLLVWFPHLKAEAARNGALGVIIHHVGRSEDINHRESCIRLLVEFARPTGTAADQSAATTIRQAQFGLKEVLQARAKQLKEIAARSQEDKEQVEEETQLTNELTKLCKFRWWQ